ncbi:hypothetical protein CMEL01_00813 [Colletotrichum melonis]|uniref:Uncharacterized protein n=1 Tax=Colletotrichum melonis TaxID=1209925 RepID=A0AAI9XYQ6_9PEZI|nr:hypothetical protein CMEL01_00813 [Colletotrichum melonis]
MSCFSTISRLRLSLVPCRSCSSTATQRMRLNSWTRDRLVSPEANEIQEEQVNGPDWFPGDPSVSMGEHGHQIDLYQCSLVFRWLPVLSAVHGTCGRPAGRISGRHYLENRTQAP